MEKDKKSGNFNQKSVLKTENLVIGYSAKAKEKVIAETINIDLQAGNLVGLIGVNGSGKSTLIRTLSGLQEKLGGSIFLGNEKKLEQISAEDRSRIISVVLTGQAISKNLSVFELVALGRQPYTNWLGKLSHTDFQIIEDALAATELQELKYEKCHTLSDGQLQRALIARALAQDTDLIILDEPTTHLDLHHKASVLSLLKNICKQTSKTILFSTHDIELVLPLCDQLIVMQDKKVVINTPKKLIEDDVFSHLFPENTIGFDKKTQRFFLKK
tara:strand:- start:174082 stop:174897 length:816 start_codon:yes stop_codon:yes gene_type:complete